MATATKGEFIDGKRTGHGVYTWSEWKLATRATSSTASGPVAASTHGPMATATKGSFVDGKLHGDGIWTLPDGSRYVVENRNGQQVSSKWLTAPGRKETEIQRNTTARTHDTTPKPRARETSTGVLGRLHRGGGFHDRTARIRVDVELP